MISIEEEACEEVCDTEYEEECEIVPVIAPHVRNPVLMLDMLMVSGMVTSKAMWDKWENLFSRCALELVVV